MEALDNRKKDLVPEDLINDFLILKNDKRVSSFNTIRDFFLFNGKEVCNLRNQNCIEYFDYLTRNHLYKLSTKISMERKMSLVYHFINYLDEKKIARFTILNDPRYFDYLPKTSKKTKSKLSKKIKSTIKKPLPEAMKQYLEYLQRSNYHSLDEYRKKLFYFIKFLEDRGKNIDVFLDSNNSDLLFQEIIAFEDMLSLKIVREEVQKSTVKNYLSALQLFVKYLLDKGVVSRKYIIPAHLRGKPNIANLYVPSEEIIKLLNSLYQHSNHVLRDTAIFLLIVDTGCRPIEIVNLTLGDLNQVERTLGLISGKSKKRIVKISKEVIEVIKDFLEVRDSYEPDSDHFFLKRNGGKISYDGIYGIFRFANIKTYGEMKYSPYAFRHTLITNVMDEHGFQQAAKLAGHETWKSTNKYLYRSKKRLLDNTLKYNPLKEKEG
ncbi:hypothetical protein CR203_23440 [Salipaludibacillus neizhouensis]|uniref:Integrase n=1 Tax=Salipaludibacillus neizhouensis TaxID=885475 RepID=A0A3A9KC80_9BACI|nr:tyrosine-type recombinase/integrase [Salipaludibacillus neizhouensis]RKL64965.1 hypothetical protein CR203_23440 [Salipaludibacillus neizhouensis]